MRKMTIRERMLAVLHGQEHDEMPFVQYDNLAAPNEVLWDYFGKDTIGVLQRTKLFRMESQKCKMIKEDIVQNGINGTKSTMYTTKGELTQIILFDPALHSPCTVKHFVKEEEDYEILLEYFRDLTVVEDIASYAAHVKYVGDAGLPMAHSSRTPFQQMWIHWVSLEDFSLHLFDIPDVVEECMTILARLQRKQFEITRKAADVVPIYVLNFPDNITAPIIGGKYFRKYCLPMYNLAAEMLEDKNIPISVHTDGDIKPLWNLIKESRIGALDSFTPKPDTDTTTEEAINMRSDLKLFLNYPSSLHLEEPSVIYENAVKILNETNRTGRMWMQVSENCPPGMWQKNFPMLIKAIREYGRPKG